MASEGRRRWCGHCAKERHPGAVVLSAAPAVDPAVRAAATAAAKAAKAARKTKEGGQAKGESGPCKKCSAPSVGGNYGFCPSCRAEGSAHSERGKQNAPGKPQAAKRQSKAVQEMAPAGGAAARRKSARVGQTAVPGDAAALATRVKRTHGAPQ